MYRVGINGCTYVMEKDSIKGVNIDNSSDWNFVN